MLFHSQGMGLGAMWLASIVPANCRCPKILHAMKPWEKTFGPNECCWSSVQGSSRVSKTKTSSMCEAAAGRQTSDSRCPHRCSRSASLAWTMFEGGARAKQHKVTRGVQHVIWADMLIGTPWHQQARACAPLRISSRKRRPYF